MPETSNYQIPYPGSDEPIAQGAETIRQGMERIDQVFNGNAVTVFPNIGGPTESGWGMTDLTQRAWLDGPRRYIFFQVRRAGPAIVGDDRGGVGDSPMVLISDIRLRPPHVVPFQLEYIGGGATYGGSGAMWPSGHVYLTAIAANTEVSRNEEVGAMSVRGWIHFIK